MVCLQELKAEDAAFPVAALERAGYGAAWIGQRTWNGVAILAKDAVPIVTRRKLPGDPSDGQSRYLEAAIDGIVIASIYAPNGNPQPGPKFDYKLAWLDRLNRHARSLLKEGVPAVFAGDYNVVPTPRDIYPTHSWDKDALVQPESRARYATLLGQGWVDTLRTMHPNDPSLFTFWHYMRNRWVRDAGLRLDHILLSPNLRTRLKKAAVDKEIRGQENASDHAPVWIELSARSNRRESATR